MVTEPGGTQRGLSLPHTLSALALLWLQRVVIPLVKGSAHVVLAAGSGGCLWATWSLCKRRVFKVANVP